jgi:hypothetical protein
MTDLEQRLAAVLASPEGQAMIEEGQQFSIEELQAAFAQVLAEANGNAALPFGTARMDISSERRTASQGRRASRGSA